MAMFQYKAINAAGGHVNGVVEGDSQGAALLALNRQGLHATEIREARAGREAQGASGFSFSRRISPLEITLFLRQLSTLINSDVPLAQSLAVLERQIANPLFRTIVEEVLRDVQGGSEFSKALAKHSRVFTPLIISMVRVGETGGMLGAILEQLAGITERDQQLKSEVRTAMVYPVIVLVVGALVVSILMTVVVPKLVNVFLELGTTLPAPTVMLIALSNFMSRWWWALLGGILLAYAAMRAWRSTEEGKLRWDHLVLSLPVMGNIGRKSAIARFSRALGVMLAGGVALLESLSVVKGVLNNHALSEAIDRAAAGLREGHSLARQLEESPLFPPLVTNLVHIGETSGNLDVMLIRIAETYEWQTNQAIKVTVALIAPGMILLLAVVVAFIALALALPLFSISQHIG